MFVLGTVIALLSWVWQFDTVPPDMMESLAAAAGLRPPAEPLSLLWQSVAVPLCRVFGLGAAEAVLRTAGHVSLGLLAVLATALFGTALPVTFGRGESVASWWRVAMRFVIFQGAALFCLSDPVWSAFRWFSPVALQTLLATLAATCFMTYLRTERRAPLFASFAVLGLLSPDTPVGAMLFVAAVTGVCANRRLAGAVALAEGANPIADALMSWRLTLAFAVGAVAGAVLEACAFAALGGLAASGWSFGDYVCRLPLSYLGAMPAACSPAGLLAFVAVVILPVLVGYRLIGRATDDEQTLKYSHGAMFLVCGLVALSQLSAARQFWFWTWPGGAGCVRDGMLRCVAMCLCALSAVWSMAVFTFELYMRNFRRVVSLDFQDEAESGCATEAFYRIRRTQRIVRTCLLLEPVVVFACIVPFRAQRLEREMLGVVAGAAEETAEECRGVERLFTDGGLDAAVELAAALKGRRLFALSLMGGVADPRETYLRTRGADDPADRALLESGAADALRTWVRSPSPGKAETYAVQIGFEVWRRDGRPMPECSGLVARPSGFAPGEAERGAEAGRALAKRVLALYGGGSPDGISDRALRDAFLFAQWRLAVLARHRANAYDGQGKRDLAMEETRIADALDRKNGALERIRATMAWASRRRLERMTPQEGLRLGLARADFALARVFALRVLDISPDDPAANFAIGMDFFVQRQYARAQTYLERCLERRPDDPAVLNNLAQCRLRRGDPAGALPYAERAQAILPESREIAGTLKRIRAALAE